MRMLLVATLCVCGVANAQVFRCTVNGATLYQDRPCAGGTKIDAKPAGGTDTKPGSIDALRINVKHMEFDRRIREAENRITASEREINALQAQRDLELRVLQEKKNYATNSLAGATWEQSISTEMQVVTDTYRTKIQVLRDRIEGSRKDIVDFRKQQSELK